MDQTTRIVLDVWGGPSNMDHVARYLPTISECWTIAERELHAGFLVNLRAEIKWGSLTPFDERVAVTAGAGRLN